MILKKGTVNNQPKKKEPPAYISSAEPESSTAAAAELIEKAKNGENDAFGQLVGIYEKFVYNAACRILTSSGCGISDAEDISQASFIKAWRCLESFRGECSFSTWLYRITINTAKDYIRAQMRHVTISLTFGDDESDGEATIDVPVTHGDEIPEDALERKELISAVREAIEELPEDQKNVIILRDIDELPYSEIADILNIEIGTVKSRINRGRQALREILIKKNIL